MPTVILYSGILVEVFLAITYCAAMGTNIVYAESRPFFFANTNKEC